MAETTAGAPLYIVMHERDNVAIVANDGGLPAGTQFPSGLTLVERVPQGHKVAVVDLAAGDAVLVEPDANQPSLEPVGTADLVLVRLSRQPLRR